MDVAWLMFAFAVLKTTVMAKNPNLGLLLFGENEPEPPLQRWLHSVLKVCGAGWTGCYGAIVFTWAMGLEPSLWMAVVVGIGAVAAVVGYAVWGMWTISRLLWRRVRHMSQEEPRRP